MVIYFFGRKIVFEDLTRYGCTFFLFLQERSRSEFSMLPLKLSFYLIYIAVICIGIIKQLVYLLFRQNERFKYHKKA